MRIWLFEVTAVVSTTSVVSPAAIATLPAEAEPYDAGEAVERQLEFVFNKSTAKAPTLNGPAIVVVAPACPISIAVEVAVPR